MASVDSRHSISLTPIALEDSYEGEHVETNDYYFEKIGEPVPVKLNDSIFDPGSPPSQPLAVSESFGLIFVAHLSGFFVVRTTDVVASAKEMKNGGTGSSIQDLSIVDVSVGKVHVLALSNDNSFLAAVVAGDVHLFSVDSLLDKAEKPYFSCSTTDSSCIKDFKWTRKPENSYLVLSKHGKLYQGSASVPFKHIMHDIDAVECSVKGKFIAVAKKDTLSIFSYKFKERLSMSLLPSSGNGDTDTDFAMKVDSIKWVRADCIIIGCFQVTATGDEEDYFVQVIRSKDGKITDVSSNKVLLSFHDIYSGFTPDILPVETGPCLLLSYLDKCKLAIVANRNNTDQHIVLLGWLQEVENEVAVIDIERDKSLPRIELQDNGDDNLVMGLCIDRVSLPGKVEVQVGNEEIREVSPYCTLLCLTLEGKLLLFHFSSANESEASDETVSACDEEEEDDTVVPTDDQPQLFSNIDQRPVSEVDESPVITRESNAKSQQMDSFAFSQPLKPSTLERPNNEIGNFTKPVKSFTGLGSVAFSGQSVDVPSQSLKSSILERPNNEIGNFNKPFHKFTGLGSVAFSGQSVDMANQSLKPSFLERPNNQIGNFDKPVQKFTGLGSVAFSEQSADVPSHPFLNVKESTIKQSSGAANAFTGFAGKPFQPKDVPSTLTQSGRQVSAGAGKIESLPVIQSSQVSLQDNFSLGKISNKKQDGSERNYGNVPLAKPMTEMCEGLDMLLESIEEPGGFLDACTTFQKSSVEALELGLATLSDQCQIWRRTMTERAQEVQNLFDRTVEVLSKKTYIEGIVTQASDSNYWEHWDRQKLSSELELKRQRILQMNQNMTNQLIELERHFNGLELNKFGGNEEIQVNERTLQRKFGSSRQSHSLHSLNNIMGSQLAAAQLLSDNLSKQIATLNIESPSSKRQSITKELFETIGITYDASFSSPNVNKIPETSSKKLLLSADSFSSKDTSRRKQRSGAKISETETGRRRRDSLDRNLASVQPPKTTVKRMILQGTPLSNEKQFRSPTLEGPATIARPASRIPSSMLSSSSKNAEQGSKNPATPFSWASPPRQKFQPLQKTNGTAPSSLPVFQSSHEMVKKSNSEAYSAASENKFAEVTYPEKSKASDFFSLARSDSVQKSNMNFEQKSSIFVTSSKPMSTPKDSIETLNPNSQKTANVKERLTTPSPLFGSANKPEPVSVGTTSSLVPTVDGLRKTEEKKPPTVFSPSVPAPAPVNTPPSASTLFSGSPLSKSFPSPAAVVDLNKPLSTSTQSSFASPVVSVSDSLFQAPKMVSPPSNLSSLNPTLVSSSKEQPMPKSDADTEKQAPASKPESRELKLQPSVTLAVGNHVEPTSVTQTVSKDVGGHVPFVVADAQPQQSPAAFVPLPTPNSTSKAAANGKSETSDALITQDDDMDEEAPETNNVEFSLSSLGGFGTTSTPMSNAPKPNPFGGSFGNVNATSMNSSFTTASPPSGELFRPASFSFQSPLASQAASQPTNAVAFSGSFGSGMATQAPAQGGFGQPAQIGVGQQALGTVLGSFGQSRQLGPSLPGTASGSPGGFNGGGFTSVKPVGGGFAGVGSGGGGGFGGGGFSGGGFAGAASTGGGFAGASPPTGGFAGATGGGFAGAAGGGFAGAAGGGFAGAAGGFGAFGNQQGSGGFSAFGAAPGGSGGTGKPPELFTQIRK
ncbi:nuclear pore complex protein NUP214 isoform X1 [Cucurbita moschata]|uniref:Nuclear pore complex protein NUP214 isoform X1 n=1 Tax=Cucurbita moschata TaxID=3662 RepID=A0A6J1G030_CUCMO|nr:nuclear pore complex protein NUP214 isoform X1 [Cucurbita moschata]